MQASCRPLARWFVCLLAATATALSVKAQVNPYKDGTPGLSGTDKVKIIATLKQSFGHAKKAIAAMSDADLEKSLDWLGGKNTQRGILLFIVRHASEHLGQSIAYARFAGVTPPWTEDMQKKQPEKK